MENTLKELIKDASAIDEIQLAEISGKLWEIGSLEEIKENTSQELFYLHVAVNMIGNWKGEGWWCIICEHADLVPYIPETLEKLNLPELKDAFESIVKLFPEYTVFKSDDALYYDICNFLQSASLKVTDERLNSITKDKRREMVKQVRQNVDKLDTLTLPIWVEDAECNGWKTVAEYISSNLK